MKIFLVYIEDVFYQCYVEIYGYSRWDERNEVADPHIFVACYVFS